jgi:radical SAM protein with 4Fe4S-binding SPASM domain
LSLLSLHRKLPLISNIKCSKVDGRYFWIAPAKGTFLVLDGKEHHIFELLISRISPAGVLLRLSTESDEEALLKQWDLVRSVVVKAARWGFVRGIKGDVYTYTLNPEKFARFHITKKCQLRCIHCYSDSGPRYRGDNELPTARWKALIEEFANVGGTNLLITGGEPLVRADCGDLLECAKKSGLSTRMLTNGLLVPKYIDVLSATLTGLQISLGSPEEKSNDNIRGKGTYKKILRALDLLVKTPIRVQVGITAMARNWRAIEDGFLRFAERYEGSGLKYHIGMGVCRHGRGYDLHDGFNIERVRFKLLALVDEANKTSARKIIHESPSCGYCEQLVVGPDGHIYPCHLLEGIIGHIDDMPIQQFFPRIRALAKRHQVGYMETCKDCNLRKACGGTCRIVNKKLAGSKFTPTCSKKDQVDKLRNLVYWATS